MTGGQIAWFWTQPDIQANQVGKPPEWELKKASRS